MSYMYAILGNPVAAMTRSAIYIRRHQTQVAKAVDIYADEWPTFRVPWRASNQVSDSLNSTD